MSKLSYLTIITPPNPFHVHIKDILPDNDNAFELLKSVAQEKLL